VNCLDTRSSSFIDIYPWDTKKHSHSFTAYLKFRFLSYIVKLSTWTLQIIPVIKVINLIFFSLCSFEAYPTELFLASAIWTHYIIIYDTRIPNYQTTTTWALYRLHKCRFIFVLLLFPMVYNNRPPYEHLDLTISKVEPVLFLNIHTCLLGQ
jgi:hypothetical protein